MCATTTLHSQGMVKTRERRYVCGFSRAVATLHLQEEEMKRAAEEKAKQEEEEAAKWLSMISVEKEGTGEGRGLCSVAWGWHVQGRWSEEDNGAWRSQGRP